MFARIKAMLAPTSELSRFHVRSAYVLSHFNIPPAEHMDLVQETLVLLEQKRAEVRSPETWALGTLRHLCLRHVCEASTNRVRRAPDAAAAAPEPAREASGENRAVLRNLLSQLPRRHAELLELHFLEGYASAELASLLGCSLSAVRTRLRRAMKAVRALK